MAGCQYLPRQCQPLLDHSTPDTHPTRTPAGQLEANSWKRAGQVRAVIERLGPAYVKVAQALSTRVDLLSPPYLLEIERLQDRVPPFEDADAMRMISEGALRLLRCPAALLCPCFRWARQHIVACCTGNPLDPPSAASAAAYGRPVQEVFSFISPNAVAAASLGQVYRGLLRPEFGGQVGRGSVKGALGSLGYMWVMLVSPVLRQLAASAFKSGPPPLTTSVLPPHAHTKPPPMPLCDSAGSGGQGAAPWRAGLGGAGPLHHARRRGAAAEHAPGGWAQCVGGRPSMWMRRLMCGDGALRNVLRDPAHYLQLSLSASSLIAKAREPQPTLPPQLAPPGQV